MLRNTLAALALSTMVGCSASSTFQPLGSRGADEQAELASYAAKAQYPSDAKPSAEIKAGALIDSRENTVKIANFSDIPMRDVNVWVNGSFVYKVGMVPSHGTVVVKPDQLFDSSGQNMSKLKATPNRVELQTGDRFYSLGTAM